MSRALVCVVGVVVLAACGNTGTNVVLARLNRSAKIQLLCADLDQPTADIVTFRSMLPLAACDPDVEDQVPTANFIAAITQTQSGEVAAVNFTNDLVFDTNRAVPGFTFIQVGEQPTGIQISPFDPSYTYISSFSARTVQAIPTVEVLTGSVTDDGLFVQTEDLPSGPTDLALYEAAEDDGSLTELPTMRFRYLYAVLPDSGLIAELLVSFATPAQVLAPPRLIGPLPTLDCNAGFEPVDPPSLGPDNSYFRICPDNRILKTVSTTITCVDGSETGPRPIALAVDTGTSDGPEDDYLLVADANQPFIYRFQLSEGGIVDDEPVRISSGTPTIALALTPPVPELESQTDATERYLYAIDAVDGSILAIDYTGEPGEGTFGAVLPVRSGIDPRANEEGVESRNRIRLGNQLNARAISVITPDYNPATIAADLCDPNDPDDSGRVSDATDPSNLQGVFLAVSLGDSTLRIVDVFDLNAPCRGGTCLPSETVADQFASIRRHRFRLGNLPTSLVGITGTPSLQFDTFPGSLNPDGTPEGSPGPGLDPTTCPNSMESVFGTNTGTGVTEGAICASSQVWPQSQQAWRAIWHGTIPFSQGGLGLFTDRSRAGEPGNWFVADDGQFCRVGVLGVQESPMDPPEDISQYRGDQLVITGDLPPFAEGDPDCEDFLENEDDAEDNPVAFRVLQAFNSELEIARTSSRINPLTRQPYTVDEVAACFNQFTEYEIRTFQAYMVEGALTGFVNRVVPDATTEECILDPAREPVEGDPDTDLNGRAFPGALYTNPLVSFEIEEFPENTLGPSTTASLNFSIENPLLAEAIFTDSGFSALPESLLFSGLTNELFFADSVAGIARIELFPLSIVQTFR